MATATMATAAGAAALLYYTLNRKIQTVHSMDGDEENEADDHINVPLGIERVSHRLVQAPATWLETISTLSETLRFTYSETLGKWPIGDLAFGISFLLKRQVTDCPLETTALETGDRLCSSDLPRPHNAGALRTRCPFVKGYLHVANVYGGDESLKLEGPEVIAELKYFLKLLTLCWHFSKKPFPTFLEETGYTKENVLLQEHKAGILKPAFTVITDHETKTLFLLIRGTHSIKDTLTAATGAVVPFHHSVVHEGGVSNLVLGYAHCGMVAAARWIAKLATPCLIKAINDHPNYKIEIVGHSLGGGTAALLTYILRERKELSAATCVTFAPAACMTWELAESGNDFITSVINGADLVPTFSAASVDDLRAEVTASAWVNDLRNQIERTRILSTVYRSASALGSHLPSMASAKAKVVGAGAMLSPVSSGTQVVMKRAQSMAQAAWSRPTIRLSSWSCIGPRRRPTASHSLSREEGDATESSSITSTCQSLETTEDWDETHIDMDPVLEDEDDIISQHGNEDRMTEVELWQKLEHELYKQRGEGDDADVAKEIKEEEEAAIAEVGGTQSPSSVPQVKEAHRFFPPGRILHIITSSSDVAEESEECECDSTSSGDTDYHTPVEPKVGIFLTPRSLYSKLRLSQTMISDHLMPVYRINIEKIIAEVENSQGYEFC